MGAYLVHTTLFLRLFGHAYEVDGHSFVIMAEQATHIH